MSRAGLVIGLDGFELPLDLATGSIGILATKGAGKTYTAAVLVEELIARGVPAIIIDPTGVHWGLKSSADGRAEGFPVTVFGGRHADLPLEETSGEVIARWFVEKRFCAILDVSLLRKAALMRFMAAFLLELYRLNTDPCHLVADEADLYCPQKTTGETARCVGALEDVVRRGRAKGIGSTLISQRPASINKDVLTQCDVLIALRIGHPRDIQPVREWIDLHGDRATAADMMHSLPALPTGTAWVWAPRADIFQRVQIRKRTTFDSSITPKIGQARIEPKVFAKIDLAKLGDEITATVERAKENDPAHLRAELGKLRGQLAKAAILSPPSPAKVEVREVPVFAPADQKALADVQAQLGDIGRTVTAIFTACAGRIQLGQKGRPAAGSHAHVASARLPRAVPTVHFAVDPKPMKLGRAINEPLGKCELAILRVLAQHPEGCAMGKIALLAGYRVSGGFRNSLGALRAEGAIEGQNTGPMRITEAGHRHGPFDPLPAGQDLRAYWLNHPSFGRCERTILAELLENGQRAMPDLATRTGYEVSGGFRNALGALRTAGVIVGRNTDTLEVSPELR